ncbi:MAG: hypothetical protein WC423_00140 [Vulcanimicrobiota bacterium]
MTTALHSVSRSIPVTLTTLEYDRLEDLAQEETEHQYDLPESLCQGPSEFPGLVIVDNSAINLYSMGGRGYDYRFLHLAEDGDTIVTGSAPCPDFERYVETVLNLEKLEVELPCRGEPFEPLAHRVMKDDHLMELLARKARSAGGFRIRPYMGCEPVWDLARSLHHRSRVQVTVEAPPPRLCERVNDKTWFAVSTPRVLDNEDSVPRSYQAHSVPALATKVKALTHENGTVCIKLRNSAGSFGNVLIRKPDVEPLEGRELCAYLLAQLERARWTEPFPVQVESWSEKVHSSPSVQLWIPLRGRGLPIVEGLFEQVLTGELGRFAGARSLSDGSVPTDVLVHEATLLAVFYQLLGYYGRCSLDAIVEKTRSGKTRVRWIECNGRWGGTSIPMTLLKRLGVDCNRQSVAIVHDHQEMSGLPFGRVLESLRPILFKQGTGIVWLSPTRLEAGEGFDYVAVGRDLDETTRLCRKVEQLLA